MKLTDEIDKASLKEDIPEFFRRYRQGTHESLKEIANEHRYSKVQ